MKTLVIVIISVVVVAIVIIVFRAWLAYRYAKFFAGFFKNLKF